MKELVQTMVENLVDFPEQVDIKKINGNNTTIFEVRVAKSDLGKVIGKKGKTANSLRTILTSVAAKNQTRAILEIVE